MVINSKKKDWTILIYADGNNELEPEMWNSKLNMEKVGSSENINVVLQIGRASRQLVNIVRPLDYFLEVDEKWTGVRRYYVLKNKSILIADLKNLNMSSPNNLYDFIKWGTENYPAKHFMLSLAGHGSSFIGVMTDLCGDLPYMMGTVEMCKAINLASTNIDILLLDICYMNIVEIMYELGKKKNKTVNNVITYIRIGPLVGLPYSKLISCVEDNIDLEDIRLLIRRIIDKLDLNLVGIEINYRKLRDIKRYVSELSYLYLTSSDGVIKINELFHNLDSSFPWYKQLLSYHNKINEIVIYYKKSSAIKGDPINLTTVKLENINIAEFMDIYYRLAFAKNNYWSYVLSKKKTEENLNYIIDIQFEPVILTRTGLKKIIQAMNPTASELEINKILKKLYSYKNWNEDF